MRDVFTKKKTKKRKKRKKKERRREKIEFSSQMHLVFSE
jgi:hypothetical protein